MIIYYDYTLLIRNKKKEKEKEKEKYYQVLHNIQILHIELIS